MDSQRFPPLCFMLTWIFVLFLSSVCSAMDPPRFYLESNVFVAFASEVLQFRGNIIKPANQSEDKMICYDSFHNQIYSRGVGATAGVPKHFQWTAHLKPLTSSGEYYCQFQTVRVYWFLLVRAHGYREPTILDNIEFLIVAIFTGVLLVFSVVGSVYVFRGDWKEQITACGKTDEKQKQNRGENETREMEEDNEDVIKAPSTSFYASLEHRTRSVYDVLDPSTANREQDQNQTKPRKDEPPKTTKQTRKRQDDDAFESVYENF